MPEEQVEKEQQEIKQEEEQQASTLPLLKGYDGAPTQEQIDLWKAEYGEVFVSGFSEQEVYLWRPLNRQEYRQMQEKAADPEKPMNQMEIEEMICEACVLWSSAKKNFKTGKAGVPQTLSDQVMHNSGFLNPQAASVLVAKL